MRLNQYIARASKYSRREADCLIEEGRVEVNGVVVTLHATRVKEGDQVRVDSKVLSISNQETYLFYKPVECLVTKHDPKGRRNIYNMLPAKLHHLHAVGRLDYLSEGLLLLTNDGNLARQLTLPQSGVVRVYEVRVFTKQKNFAQAISELARGATLKVDDEAIRYRPIKLEVIKSTGSNYWLRWRLTEGKNREIRNICKHYEWQVARLKRTEYGEYKLGELEPGQMKKVG